MTFGSLFTDAKDNVVVLVFLILATVIGVPIYIMAFLQGRELSLGPAKIGARPAKPESRDGADHRADAAQSGLFGPIIQKGTKLTTASEKTFTIESAYYGGATATLFRATDASGGKVIAKVFWRGLMPNSPQWDAFTREYQVSEILTHRNIVRQLDRGLISGYPFIVMEYLPGGTLRDLMQARDHIRGPDILSIAGQLADAIDFAHANGVVHRDIKPGNILFESDAQGRVALSDFGVAKIFGAAQRDITANPAEGPGFAGSAGYIAPEAFTGASDIYSFGVVVFEMIAGKIPFDEIQDVYAILQAKVSRPAPDIRTFRPVTDALAMRLAQALSIDPADRPASARALLSGIEGDIRQL